MQPLGKGVSLTSSWQRGASLLDPQNLRYTSGAFGTYPDNFKFLDETGTGAVRIFLNLPDLWPTPGGLNMTLVNDLDTQIAAVYASGRIAILALTSNYPEWINGWGPNSGPLGSGGREVSPATNKEPITKLPADVSINSAWAIMVWSIASRYSLANPNRPWNGYSLVSIFEVLNEPNNLAWQGTDQGFATARKVAAMMVTAKQIAATLNNSPVMGGPGLLDTPNTNAYQTEFPLFNQFILDRLHDLNFFNPPAINNHAFLWTQHSYGDVRLDVGPDSVHPDGTNHVNTHSRQTVDQLEANGWRGAPDGVSSAATVFLTEGGANLTTVAKPSPAGWGESGTAGLNRQAWCWQQNWNRMKTTTQGKGVYLTTQYQFHTTPYVDALHPGFDSGLVERATPPPLRRAAYYTSAALS